MMKQIAFGFFALFGFSAVTACGFTPLYGGETAGNLVTVEEIEGRAGHALRKALLQNLAAGLPGPPVALPRDAHGAGACTLTGMSSTPRAQGAGGLQSPSTVDLRGSCHG